MALPAVPAWIIDYATARGIFMSRHAALKSRLEQMCVAGTMKFCACEESSFRANAHVRGPFCDNPNCRCNLSAEIVVTAGALPDAIGHKKVNPTDISAKIIVACALNYNFGIVSAKTGIFLSPVELGAAQGLTCLTLPQFIALL